jgi:NAD+--dinitrogen-reductase ADP-D-ribosyltransferase
MNTYKHNVDIFDQELMLPDQVFLTLNRCNIPPAVLGSLRFQQHPQAVFIDSIKELHKAFFTLLGQIDSAEQRAKKFIDYVDAHFRLSNLNDAGLVEGKTHNRDKADYRHILRGWLFDPDSRDGAVLKSWVESRFGLLTRFHRGPLSDPSCYKTFRQACSQGLYNTNALEAQIDLLYSYCQYELSHQYEVAKTLLLYRGINNINSIDILQLREETKQAIVLLNNLNSFSCERERADEFGDHVVSCQVPWQKILFFSNLLPGVLAGESEYLVIGGAYEIGL